MGFRQLQLSEILLRCHTRSHIQCIFCRASSSSLPLPDLEMSHCAVCVVQHWQDQPWPCSQGGQDDDTLFLRALLTKNLVALSTAPSSWHDSLLVKHYDSWTSFNSMIHSGPLSFITAQNRIINRCLTLSKKN